MRIYVYPCKCSNTSNPSWFQMQHPDSNEWKILQCPFRADHAWKLKWKDFPEGRAKQPWRKDQGAASRNLSRALLLAGKGMAKHFTTRSPGMFHLGTALRLPFFPFQWKRLFWFSCPISPLRFECGRRGGWISDIFTSELSNNEMRLLSTFLQEEAEQRVYFMHKGKAQSHVWENWL